MATTATPADPSVPILYAEYVERHSRVSVGFRLIVAIPQMILLYLLSILAALASVVGWFAAVVMGRLPGPIHRYLARYVGYNTRVTAYLWLLTDRYPPVRFEAEYPFTVELGPQGRLNRLAVLFRYFIALPAALLNGLVNAGYFLLLFFVWLFVLATGRMPRALFEAAVAVLRFAMRLGAYWSMVTPAYPGGLFGDEPEFEGPKPPPPGDMAPIEPVPAQDAPPEGAPGGIEPPPLEAPGELAMAPPAASPLLLLSKTAKRWLVAFIVLGVVNWIGFGLFYVEQIGTTVKANEAGTEFVKANQALGLRVALFQQQVGTCNTRPEPFRCAQVAETALASSLDTFGRRVASIDFPGEVSSQVSKLRDATARFHAALRALVAAQTEEQYFDLTRDLEATANAFDAAVQELLNALSQILD